LFDPDLIWRAPWHELYAFFAAGNPPLILQLLGLNTIFFVIYCFRAAHTKYALRAGAAFAVQFLLISANAVLMFQRQLNISPVWLNDISQNAQALAN
jgi:hypothetical protein